MSISAAHSPLVNPPPDFESPASRPAEAFATTHWSMVMRAGDSQSPEAARAMERLCRTYWYPLYAFVRRRGYSHEDGADLTQGFFARFLEKHYLRSVDANLGKFRTFLLTSMSHFMANARDRDRMQKRGGGHQVISLDEMGADERYQLEPADPVTPEQLYDRQWAETVIGVVLDRLAEETEEKRFGVLKAFLLHDQGAMSYEDAAGQLGVGVAAVTSAIHRMRARFRALLFEEVAHTVGAPEEVEPEIRHLLASLAD